MAVGSKLIKRKGKISKSDLEKGRRPSVLTSGWPDVVKLSKEEKFLNKLQDLIDSGIEIEEEDIPDDMLDVWDEFKEDIKPKLVKKNLAFWTTIFAPVIIPGLVKGMRSEPTVPQPKVIIKGRQQEVIPPAKPREIVDYAKKYFEERGLELCKSLTETDLSRLKEDLKANWGKGEKAFSDTFEDSYPVSKSRLETIYRSERHISEYAGVLERAKQANHSYKRWETVGDERTCDICLAMDGEIVPINEKFSNGQMVPSAHPNCYSSDTEVFTENGWKLFKDVNPYEKIWTLNVDTGSLELDDQVNQISYHFKGNMLHIHNKSFDCLVTPDHNMIVKSGWNYTHNPESPYIYRLAKNIKPGDRIPRTAFNWRGNNPEYIKISERKFDPVKFMTFMGWYVSEGSICKPKGADWQIHISQIKKDNKKEILELCQQLFNKVWECEEYICIPNIGDISEYFLALGHSNEKYIPSEIKNMSKELLSKFMESFIKGDGNTRTNKWIGYNYIFGKEINVSTSSIRLANDLTEVMLKLSRTPSFYIQKPKLTYFKKHPVNHSGLYLPKYDQISIRMNEITHTYYKPSMLEYLPYDGIVYCLEMKNNHSLYIRRNRKATWSGNCRCSMTTYSEENYSDLPDEFIRQDASYLNEVADFMKFNYKCEFNGSDWKCPESIPTDKINDNKHKGIAMYSNPLGKGENGLEFNARLWKVDQEVLDLINEKVEGSPEYNLFNKLGDKWLRGVDPEAREDAIKVVQSDKLLKSYLLHQQFGLDIPEKTIIFRVGRALTGMTNSFFPNREAAESYQKRMGGDNIYEYEVSTQYIIPSMSGAGEIWVPGDVEEIEEVKRNSSYLNEVSDYLILQDASDFMKLNYKCPKGSHDEGFGCGGNIASQPEPKQTPPKQPVFIGFKADHDFNSKQNIEHNMKIQSSLDKAALPLKKYTSKEKAILTKYSGNLYQTVNSFISNGSTDMPDFMIEEAKRAIDDLDKLFTKSNIIEPLVVYRGIKDDIMVKNPSLKEALDTPGSEIQFPCFSSTSALPYVANNFADGYNGRMLELQLPTGTKALFIAGESGIPQEFEVLVNRGTKFEVGKTRYVDIKGPKKNFSTGSITKRTKVTTIKAIV